MSHKFHCPWPPRIAPPPNESIESLPDLTARCRDAREKWETTKAPLNKLHKSIDAILDKWRDGDFQQRFKWHKSNLRIRALDVQPCWDMICEYERIGRDATLAFEAFSAAKENLKATVQTIQSQIISSAGMVRERMVETLTANLTPYCESKIEASQIVVNLYSVRQFDNVPQQVGVIDDWEANARTVKTLWNDISVWFLGGAEPS